MGLNRYQMVFWSKIINRLSQATAILRLIEMCRTTCSISQKFKANQNNKYNYTSLHIILYTHMLTYHYVLLNIFSVFFCLHTLRKGKMFFITQFSLMVSR